VVLARGLDHLGNFIGVELVQMIGAGGDFGLQFGDGRLALFELLQAELTVDFVLVDLPQPVLDDLAVLLDDLLNVYLTKILTV
jgi:hypothetical protein